MQGTTNRIAAPTSLRSVGNILRSGILRSGGRFLRVLVLSGWSLAFATGQIRAQAPQAGEPHGRDIHGVVVAVDDGQPLPGTEVRLLELGLGELTHGDGTFHIEGVPPGTYTVQADRLGYAVEQREVTVTEEGVEVRFELRPQALAIDPLVVTASGRVRTTGEAIRPVNVVSERELLRQLDGTLAASLDEEAGVTTTSMGPATAKPVIRGLSGDRVLILEDGERVADLSASSSDHATATDPLSARRIEVVRGPAALLYGSNALGGVVNVIREEVPRRVPDRLTGTGSLEGSSVNEGLAGGASARVGIGSEGVVRLEGSGRTFGDLATPGGDLENTDGKVLNLAGGASWVPGGGSYVGASYRFYDNEYGIPGGFVGAHEDGVRIDMRRNQIKGQGEWIGVGSFPSRLEVSGTFTDYAHRELESGGIVGTAFDRHTATAEVRLHHDELGPFSSGAAGVRYQWDDHRFGGGLDTEDTRRTTLGAYVLEELELGRVTLEGGARYDWGRTTPEREFVSSQIGAIRERDFGSFSGSVGTLVSLPADLTVGLNLSRAFRMPDIGELYSEGPHLAAYSFEVGNPELEEEVGTGLDLFLRLDRSEGRAEVALFQNRIDGYVFPRNTGRISRVQLPIYQFVGEDVLLQGVEASGEWGLSDRLVIDANGSWVRGELTATDEPVPFMPPLQGSSHLRYETPSWFLEGGVRAAAEQDRVGEFETPTAGYAVWDVSGGLRVSLGGQLHTVTLRLENLTDRTYRNHLSRTKEIMPQAGIDLRLLYRMSF